METTGSNSAEAAGKDPWQDLENMIAEEQADIQKLIREKEETHMEESESLKEEKSDHLERLEHERMAALQESLEREQFEVKETDTSREERFDKVEEQRSEKIEESEIVERSQPQSLNSGTVLDSFGFGDMLGKGESSNIEQVLSSVKQNEGYVPDGLGDIREEKDHAETDSLEAFEMAEKKVEEITHTEQKRPTARKPPGTLKTTCTELDSTDLLTKELEESFILVQHSVMEEESQPQEMTVESLKRDLESWREILLPIHRFLIWEQKYFAGIIMGVVTLNFLLLWYLDPSILTILSIYGLILCILDYVVPLASASVFDADNWTGEKEKQYEEICTRILHIRDHVYNFLTMLADLKNKKPKVYFVSVMGVLAMTAWIGNLIDNLCLAYLIVSFLVMLPGLRYHGIIQQVSKKVLSTIQQTIGGKKQKAT